MGPCSYCGSAAEWYKSSPDGEYAHSCSAAGRRITRDGAGRVDPYARIDALQEHVLELEKEVRKLEEQVRKLEGK